jgi:hypothetical protein
METHLYSYGGVKHLAAEDDRLRSNVPTLCGISGQVGHEWIVPQWFVDPEKARAYRDRILAWPVCERCQEIWDAQHPKPAPALTPPAPPSELDNLRRERDAQRAVIAGLLAHGKDYRPQSEGERVVLAAHPVSQTNIALDQGKRRGKVKK